MELRALRDWTLKPAGPLQVELRALRDWTLSPREACAADERAGRIFGDEV